MESSRFGRRSRNDDGIVHRPVLFERADDINHAGGFLADRYIDADDIVALLIDDGIKGNRRLSGLAITDDELTLSAANGNHGIDGLDSGLEGHRH